MRTIPEPGFATDDGSVSAGVAAALREVTGGAGLEVAIAALCGSRLLVPVVALPGDEGGAADAADMAAVLLTGRDGRRALLAFTELATLRTWDPAARPVPVTARHAAQAALAEGADALVVDLAGPVQVPIEGDGLRRVADGHHLVRTADAWAWRAPRRRDDTGPV